MLARRRGKNGRGAADGRGTFVLGVGAQKAGTTWLYDYLRRSPDFVAGYRKEYHVFDARDLQDEQWLMDRQVRAAEEALQHLREHHQARGGVIHRMAMVAEPRFYFDYFAGLIATRDGARFAADLTPDYGMLSAERFTQIREKFADRGVRVAPTMLMRDPVERIYSTLRMMQRVGTDFFTGSPEQALLDHHHRQNLDRRTRYDRTIEALEAAFQPDEIFYGFYETLFTTAEIERFCRFLGMPFHRPDLASRRNASPRADGELPESTRRVVAEHYGDVYAFVADRFGRDRVLELWPNARWVL